MEEIVDRLKENRQIELAKSILESAGYQVGKKDKIINESLARYAQTDEQEEVLDFIETTAKSLGINLRFGTSIGMKPQTVIVDYKYQDGIVRVNSNGSCEINGVKIGSYKDDYFDLRDYEREIEDAINSIKEVSESKQLSESVEEEYRDSVEEFFGHLQKAFEILKNTEEGVIESLAKDKLLYDRFQDYVYNLDNALTSGIRESSEDLVSKVKKALDDASISYETIGKNKDRLVVSKENLKKASEIRDEIDPEYTVTVSSRA